MSGTNGPLTFFESIALPLVERGMKVAPCLPRSKTIHGVLVPHPLEMLSSDPGQIRRWGSQAPRANVCVYAQQIQGGLCFLDNDAGDIREIYRRETKRDFQTLFVRSSIRNGVERGHWYFLQTPGTRALEKNLTEADTNGYFSFRVKNEYVVSAGSIHPDTGEPYVIRNDCPIIYMPGVLLDWLQTKAGRKATKTRRQVTGRGKIPKGQRYPAIMREVGRLWEHGYPRELTIRTGIEWAKENVEGDFDENKLRKEIGHLVDSYEPGPPRTGTGNGNHPPPELAIGEPETVVSDWPAPEPLGEDLPAVPAFDVEMLPESLRPLVSDISERMQVPLDFPAAAAIVALGGCTGRRVRVHPKVNDNWQVIANLWGGIVAPPGYMKSPTQEAVMRPLAHVEQMWRAHHDAEMEEYRAEKEKQGLRHQAWRDNYKRACKKNEELPPEPDDTLVAPPVRRLLVGDATPEKLQEILADNPAGVMVLRDEMVGLIAEMDKEGRESQRTFFLQGWGGYGAFYVDRIGRGSLRIPHVCISVFGTIQPARLRNYLADAMGGGPTDDGLFQRLQVLVWPDAPASWRLVDRVPDNAALARAEKIFSALANRPTESVRMSFGAEAQERFFTWLGELERKIRARGGLHPAFVSHLSKYRSLLPTIAGLFELADLIAKDARINDEAKIEISDAHTEQAAQVCSYLEAHARRVYSCITAPELHAGRELAKHIERGAVAGVFTKRDVYRHQWESLDSPERVESALAVLEDAGWIRRAPRRTTAVGGRPVESWVVNPAIRGEGL